MYCLKKLNDQVKLSVDQSKMIRDFTLSNADSYFNLIKLNSDCCFPVPDFTGHDASPASPRRSVARGPAHTSSVHIPPSDKLLLILSRYDSSRSHTTSYKPTFCSQFVNSESMILR